MQEKKSKEGFALSILLHASVVGCGIFLTVFNPFAREKPPVFELVSLPPPQGSPDGGLRSSEFPDMAGPPAAAEPVAAPQPVPVRTEPKPTPPKPQPAKPPATTPAKPVPKPPEAAKPKPPAAKPPPPATLTKEEFDRLHPKKPAAGATTRKPSATGGTTGRNTRRPPKIDTNFGAVLSEALTDPNSLGGMSGAQQTEIGLYIARLKNELLDSWDRPAGLADSLSARVEFDVLGDGRIVNVRLVRSSGNTEYDRTVLTAFANLRSFEPTPEGRKIPLRFNFNMTDD